jgi:DeoR/GlpR family transcriptional regulator of sugar metabolism
VQRSIRQKLIVQTVRGSGRISTGQLAELTGASAVTIRRDLADLEAHGSLRRTRGGAARAAKFGEDVSYRIRASEDQPAKARLAEAAAALINDYDSLIIDNGTTCDAVAHELAGRPVTALCLSLHVAAALAAVPGARVIVPGGPVEPDTLALYGRSPTVGKDAREEPSSRERTGISRRPVRRTADRRNPDTAGQHRAGPMSRGRYSCSVTTGSPSANLVTTAP